MREPRSEILLVEDDPNDVELTLLAFKRNHITNRVHVAADGDAALDFLFCTGPHAGGSVEDRPKLVLLDLNLPTISGRDVLRRIKTDPRTRSIPVVILTSSSHARDLQETYDLGANSYIVKPVDFEQFSRVVRALGEYWMLINRPPIAPTTAGSDEI